MVDSKWVLWQTTDAEFDLAFSQDEQGNHKLPQDDVQTIKRELIALMTSAKPSIQFQLGEAIAVIADSDFWDRWDTLVDVGART